MANFQEYSDKYEHVKMERKDGILQITVHTNGGPLQWGGGPHSELPRAFADIGSDRENRVVILTGTGDAYSGPRATPDRRPKLTPAQWDSTYWEGKQLLMNLLGIEVPMIAAVNGPALRHAQLPLTCDIVLAAEHASFQDSAHFPNGLVPGDGVHVIFPMLMGLNRARYFLLTGQELTAQKAHEIGLVAEVLPKDKLLPRAWELAEQLAEQSDLVLRYSRVMLTQNLKRQILDYVGYGLALEGMGSAQDLVESGQS